MLRTVAGRGAVFYENSKISPNCTRNSPSRKRSQLAKSEFRFLCTVIRWATDRAFNIKAVDRTYLDRPCFRVEKKKIAYSTKHINSCVYNNCTWTYEKIVHALKYIRRLLRSLVACT